MEFRVPKEKPTPIEYLAAFVEVNFTIVQTMRRLQETQGGFVYSDLADVLATRYEIPLEQAREMVWEFVTNMNGLMAYDGRLYHLVEADQPTMEETVASFAAMAATYRPRKPHPLKKPPLRRDKPVAEGEFEQFRPRRSATRFLQGAPSYVIACYDNGGKTVDRFTVLFGGALWDTQTARENWVSGINPRVTPCLSMSDYPSNADGVSSWGQCLRGPQLGKKVAWQDLPIHIRNHVIGRANGL